MSADTPTERYIVSACLAGLKCRYDGGCCEDPKVLDLIRQGRAIPVCPEQLAGLATPRDPIELAQVDGQNRVLCKTGGDVTDECMDGVEQAVRLAQLFGATRAILKFRSPTCSIGTIYDGTFTGNTIPGNGLFAQRLIDLGFQVEAEEDPAPPSGNSEN